VINRFAEDGNPPAKPLTRKNKIADSALDLDVPAYPIEHAMNAFSILTRLTLQSPAVTTISRSTSRNINLH
jgi:hypothetical protein